jgi:hypothetical protein
MVSSSPFREVLAARQRARDVGKPYLEAACHRLRARLTCHSSLFCLGLAFRTCGQDFGTIVLIMLIWRSRQQFPVFVSKIMHAYARKAGCADGTAKLTNIELEILIFLIKFSVLQKFAARWFRRA